MERLIRFFKDERGASGVEYGILVAAIAGAFVLAAYTMGTKVNAAFTLMNAKLP